jgi:hypothetical protein
MNTSTVEFPEFSGLRCLMMPYIQGDTDSLPDEYACYFGILEQTFLCKGEIGFLTIDEAVVSAGTPHRGARATTSRAIHTEAGRAPGQIYGWGGGGGKWGAGYLVTLDRDVQILLASNVDDSCAVWDATHEETSDDGDLGHVAELYPYASATLLKAGEVHKIGILTPHESVPVKEAVRRQFLRILGSGVHGREPYFTKNPLVSA